MMKNSVSARVLSRACERGRRLLSLQTAETAEKGSLSSRELIELENSHSAKNYRPVPVVFSKARGVNVWDAEGNKYMDFLSGYSAVNQGHCHPRIVAALREQAELCTLSSRAFYNDKFPLFAKMMTELFEFERVLPMNSGAEAVDTALKVARKWGYERKGIDEDKVGIVSACGCFHGRTFGAISMSCSPSAVEGFGPHLPNQEKVDYGDSEQLSQLFERKGSQIAAFIVEPIQGEAGVILPPDGYLRDVRRLCTSHNVLFIADEIQTGLGRTGSLLACDHEGVKPDMLILGKALSGGVLPISAVLANDNVMNVLQANQHGSTFGGNSLAAAVGMEAIKVLLDEGLSERAARLGQRMKTRLESIKERSGGLVTSIRGRGLLYAIDIKDRYVSAYNVCMSMKEQGLLAKPTHGDTIRLAPALVITESELDDAMSRLEHVIFEEIPKLRSEQIKAGQELGSFTVTCKRCGREILD